MFGNIIFLLFIFVYVYVGNYWIVFGNVLFKGVEFQFFGVLMCYCGGQVVIVYLQEVVERVFWVIFGGFEFDDRLFEVDFEVFNQFVGFVEFFVGIIGIVIYWKVWMFVFKVDGQCCVVFIVGDVEYVFYRSYQ